MIALYCIGKQAIMQFKHCILSTEVDKGILTAVGRLAFPALAPRQSKCKLWLASRGSHGSQYIHVASVENYN